MPGYPGAHAAWGANGGRPVRVAVDAQGLRVDAGVRRSPHARLVYVTPSHQLPARRHDEPSAAAGTPALGGGKRGVGLRGRLRRRIPLPRPSARGLAGTRHGRAGALRGHLPQGALSRAAAGLSRRARKPGDRLRGRADDGGRILTATAAGDAGRFPGGGTLLCAPAHHARAVSPEAWRAAACAGRRILADGRPAARADEWTSRLYPATTPIPERADRDSFSTTRRLHPRSSSGECGFSRRR